MTDLTTGLLIGLDVSTSAAPDADPVGEAREAERLGFDFVSASDHPSGRHPTYETATLLTWIAARTSRVAVASRVLGVPFRRPAMVAKAAESLDRLSGGRLILGLGAGYSDEEIAAVGAPAATAREKVDGLADAVRIIRGAWTRDGFDHAGAVHRVSALDVEPKPDRRIPVWLGTFGPRALEVTGRLADGWIPSLGFAPPERVPAMRERMLTAAEASGRRPEEVRCVYNVGVRVDDAAGARPGLVTGPAERVAARLREFLALGFTGFNLQPQGPDRARQVRVLAAEVLPALRETVGDGTRCDERWARP